MFRFFIVFFLLFVIIEWIRFISFMLLVEFSWYILFGLILVLYIIYVVVNAFPSIHYTFSIVPFSKSLQKQDENFKNNLENDVDDENKNKGIAQNCVKVRWEICEHSIEFEWTWQDIE